MRHICTLLLFPFLGLAQTSPVVVGADVLIHERFDLIEGKRVGLVTNHSALLADGEHLADALHALTGTKLVALYGPEHGIRGDSTGPVENAIDSATGVPVFSLYGKSYKPTLEMLTGVDVLIFDIQDVGARFYTYVSTLGHVMSAAAENNIPVIVLDRPNPVTGLYVDGPIAEDSLKSFVAYAPIPIAHGMTIGELAFMYNGEGWLDNGVAARLTVVEMKNWKRSMWYDQTGLTWVRLSPNMLTLSTAIPYTGTCLFEGINISEGRGTDRPFEYIGAPWSSADTVSSILNSQRLAGVKFVPKEFTPTRRPNDASVPKFESKLCKGVFVDVTDRDAFQPVRAGVWMIWAFKQTNPSAFQWRSSRFDRLAGTARIRNMLDQGKTPPEIFATWDADLRRFCSIRTKYLIYD